MFIYSYCYVCSVLGILFHCVVLCIVCVQMCTVLLPPDVNSIAVNKYIISSMSTICFDIKQIRYFLKLCIFEFHVILKTNVDYLLKYHPSTGVGNKYGMCSL